MIIVTALRKFMEHKPYNKLAISLIISLVIMYAVMFLNVYDADHVYLSVTRLYMAILMVAPMAVLMLLMMGHMFMNKRLNMLIHGLSVAVFLITLILLRTQTPVNDKQYMRAMIPHHSSAILTSKRANIDDPEVLELSKKIIKSQEREIKQMKDLLERMK